MKTCQNCEFNKELCGERDCHFTGQKTVENGVCSRWEANLETYKKAWEIAYLLGISEECPEIKIKECKPNFIGEFPCTRCYMDYAMKQAIEGG